MLVPYQAVSNITGNSVLVLAPHPDDEVFGCGGAIMRHTEQHIPVQVIIVTDGVYGVDQADRSDYLDQRRQESIAAAAVLGYGEPVFWSYRDRSLRYGEKLITEIQSAIQSIKADLVYAPSVYEIHPDHHALAIATAEAIRRSTYSIQLALYEVGQPMRPNLLLDISNLATRKMKAMNCFTSQNAKQRYDLDIAALNRYRTYTLPVVVTSAEAYFLTNTAELANNPFTLYQPEHVRQHKLGLIRDKQNQSLVSVIIRSTDRPTLAEALDSVALQTYPNIEVIVINAKGDKHCQLDAWCGRFPVRVISGDKQPHRSSAANLGLEAAKGDYIIFLDDDDWFLPHHITVLENKLNQYNSAIAAYAGIQCIDEHGREVNRYAINFDPTQLRIENYIPIHAALFRRTVLDYGARFDEQLDFCEDWDFWLQILQHGTFCFVPEIGAVYRTIDGQGSGIREKRTQRQQSMIAIYKKWMPHWNDESIWHILEYAMHKKKSDALQTEVLQLKRDIAELNTIISRLRASSSWRITYPLRQLKRLLNRLGSKPESEKR